MYCTNVQRGNFPMRSQEEIFISDFRGHSHFSTILKYILKDSLEEVSDGFLMEVETYPACGRPARNGSDGIMQNTILFLHKLPVDWQNFMCSCSIYSLKIWKCACQELFDILKEMAMMKMMTKMMTIVIMRTKKQWLWLWWQLIYCDNDDNEDDCGGSGRRW